MTQKSITTRKSVVQRFLERIRRKSRFERAVERMEQKEKITQLLTVLDGKLVAAGFGSITDEDLRVALKNANLTAESPNILRREERVYGLGLSKARSNFFVFVKIEKGTIEIYYTNPRKDNGAVKLKRDQVHARRKINIGDSEKRVNEIVREILQVASHKTESDCRLQVHSHQNSLFRKRDTVFDDGGGTMNNILRNLIASNADAFAPTPHNSSDKRMHAMMKVVCERMGIVYFPSLELTMPIESPNALNGPHMVIMCADIRTSERIRLEILNRRDASIIAPPYFSGMILEEMFSILERLKKEGRVAIMPAHPVIQEFVFPIKFRELDVSLYITGLFSSVETKSMPLSAAISYGRRSTAIAMYNGLGTHTGLKLNDRGLVVAVEDWAKKVFGRAFKKLRITQNVASMAIAKAFESKGVGTFFESDDHADGIGFHGGFTQLSFKDTLLAKLQVENRKPTSNEIISGLESKEVQMSGFVYSEISDGILQTIKARTDQKLNLIERAEMFVRRTWGYVRGFGKTAIDSILEGNWWRLGRMAK